jgi:hypothetical protein
MNPQKNPNSVNILSKKKCYCFGNTPFSSNKIAISKTETNYKESSQEMKAFSKTPIFLLKPNISTTKKHKKRSEVTICCL